jgi:broad specificity phosphatase PhoE
MRFVLVALTLLLVRHAEKKDSSLDTPLSPAGEQRAQSLAAKLKDAHVTAIYATNFQRTQQTVKPLADALHLQVKTHEAKDTAGLVALLKKEQGTVVVAGHSNTVPEIAAAFGCKLDPLAENEFDSLFVVGDNACIKLHQ